MNVAMIKKRIQEMQNKLNDMLLESPLDAKEVLDLSIELNDLIARMLKEMRPEQT